MHINRGYSKGMWKNIIAGDLEFHGIYHGEHNQQKLIWVIISFQIVQSIIKKNNFSPPFFTHVRSYLLSCSAHAEPLPYQLQDEGKCSPLEVIKLEGAEVGIDSSLGKPFVFNCVPQSGNRTFCFCATSNQEMKR